MTTPNGNDAGAKKKPVSPPQKAPLSGIPLGALWPKVEESRDQKTEVRGQGAAVSVTKPAPVPAPMPVLQKKAETPVPTSAPAAASTPSVAPVAPPTAAPATTPTFPAFSTTVAPVEKKMAAEMPAPKTPVVVTPAPVVAPPPESKVPVATPPKPVPAVVPPPVAPQPVVSAVSQPKPPTPPAAVVAAPQPASAPLAMPPPVASSPKTEGSVQKPAASAQKAEVSAPKTSALHPLPSSRSSSSTPARKAEKPRPPRKPAAPAKTEVKEQKSEVGVDKPVSVAAEAATVSAASSTALQDSTPPVLQPSVAPVASAPAPEQVAEPAPSQPARPARAPLYIAMVASECAPVAKVGGLGDVVFGLSRELEIRGNSVEIFLPKYDCLRYDQIFELTLTYKDLWVPWFAGAIHCSVYFGFVHGRKCFFIEPHSADNFFNRKMFYGQKDDDLRFAFFCRAVLEYMLKSGKNPDVIHCHDWQTALIPVLLFEMYKFLGMGHPRACFTLHNLQHQGVTGAHILQATGLNRPEYFFHQDRLQDNANRAALNLMKGGIVYSNFVTTVSPHYAWEIMNTNQDYGLGRTLHTHAGKIGGILNGLDYEAWNPELDRHIPQVYGPATADKKYADKQALRQRFWLQDVFKPIVSYIGRLDHQKGVPLITHAINYCLQHGCQFVLLGTSPDAKIAQHFWALKQQFNDNPDCHIEIGFNEDLSHLIYAGADMIIVPSLFEPCGLTQLIGLKYGTVPIVRAVGGLADTVFDANYSSKPYPERNGYVFNDFNAAGIESALSRAIGLWYNYPQHFRELMLNGMRSDYSWNHSGEDYLNVYDLIRDK